MGGLCHLGGPPRPPPLGIPIPGIPLIGPLGPPPIGPPPMGPPPIGRGPIGPTPIGPPISPEPIGPVPMGTVPIGLGPPPKPPRPAGPPKLGLGPPRMLPLPAIPPPRAWAVPKLPVLPMPPLLLRSPPAGLPDDCCSSGLAPSRPGRLLPGPAAFMPKPSPPTVDWGHEASDGCGSTTMAGPDVRVGQTERPGRLRNLPSGRECPADPQVQVAPPATRD